MTALALALWLALLEAPDGGPGDAGADPAAASPRRAGDPDAGPPGRADARDPDAEVIEQLDLLEQLELLDHLELFDAPPLGPGKP